MAQYIDGTPVGVTLVGDVLASQLEKASMTGQFELADGNERDPTWLFYNLGVNRAFNVVIVNSLYTTLSLVDGGELMVHGDQVGYPALTNYLIKVADTEHQIPPHQPHPKDATQKLTGVGVYTFSYNSTGLVGGVLCFSYGGSGKRVAVAFRKGFLWVDPIAAVTADLFSQYNSVQEFYDNTVDNSVSIQSHIAKEATVYGSVISRQFDVGNYVPRTVTFWVKNS